jgi:hypothetical protein
MASVGLTFYYIGVCTFILNHLLQEVRVNVLCNGRVKHSGPCVLSVPEYAVHFTHCLRFGNVHDAEEI